MIFSLIMATRGRYDEVRYFIECLVESDFNLSQVELIIVDQNIGSYLDDIVVMYNDKIKIIHVKSCIIGLSYNRNLGMKYASGEVLAFPDDDCCYNINTLASVYACYLKNKSVYLGRVCDIDSNKEILRKWYTSTRVYNSNFDLCYNVSSISMFIPRANLVGFDEQFGVGAKYGSCEDVDFLLTLYNNRVLIRYNPDIVILHPDVKPNYDKLYKYGVGWGALYKKHLNLKMCLQWILILFYHSVKLILLITDLDSFKNQYRFILGQINGFINYKK